MNRPPIKKTCPECGGDYQNQPCSSTCFAHITHPCEDCGRLQGICQNCVKGEVYNYLTPEQWEAETGDDMLDSDSVWHIVDYGDHKEWILTKWYMLEVCADHPIIIARIDEGQPKPDNSWRPE